MPNHVVTRVAIAVALAVYGTTAADARPSTPQHRLVRSSAHQIRGRAHDRSSRSALAEIAIDANSGRTLYALN